MLQKDQIFQLNRRTQFVEVTPVQNLLWAPEVAFSLSWSLNLVLYRFYLKGQLRGHIPKCINDISI